LASLFTHGFSFDLDGDRVMDNAVHDGISDRSLSKTLVPLRDGLKLLPKRNTLLPNTKETGRYGRHGREQGERDKGSTKV